MIRALQQLLMVLMLLSGIALYGVEDKPGWTSKFNEWCCKKLGYGCGAPKATQTRGTDQTRPKGGDLMMLDLKTHAVSTIWKDCVCWSPVPAQEGMVAVATSDGIWIVPVNKPEKRRLAFHTDVLELVGTELTSDGGMLFLRSSKNPECDFEPWKATSDYSGALRANLDPDLACGESFNFQNLTKPAQTSKAGTVTTVLYRGRY